MTRKKPTASIKERCLSEALAIIDEKGLENLSLREVARRVGVSHQAPYQHFPSRDHILAALLARLYAEFADYVDDRPHVEDPMVDLGNMGVRYLDYAITQPLKYRLLFNTALPDQVAHPEMMLKAQHAFDILETRLAQMPLRSTGRPPKTDARADAFFIWSVLHGAASILESDARSALEITDADKEIMIQHIFDRIGAALNPDVS